VPETDVFFYQESDGGVPAIAWLDTIADNPRDKLFYRVNRLEQAGYELRRPEADFLRDGIFELRVKWQRVNYRLLYFFHGKEAVIAHGCVKEGPVDDADINRAAQRKELYGANPARHRYELVDE
jgi:hypothetical protein